MKILKKIYFFRKILQSNKFYKKNPIIFDNLFLEIINIKFIKNPGFFEKVFFKNINVDLNLVIKQYVISNLFFENKNFGKFMLFFLGIKKPFAYFFPVQLLRKLKKYYKINTFLSLILFKIYELKEFLKGIYFFLNIIIKSSIGIFTNKKKIRNYIYFCNTLEKLLPKKENGFDMITSVIKNEKFTSKEFDFFHDFEDSKKQFLNIQYKNIFILDSFTKIYFFFINGIKLLGISFISIFLNKWYFSLLIRETLKKSIIEINKDQLAKKYFFNFTYYIYRPLWTYSAEKHNSEISMIFQATNFYQRNILNKNYLYLMNWPEYQVWNESQKNYFTKILNGNYKFKVCDYIDFNDGNNILREKYDLVIFDDPPYRELFSAFFLKFYDHWNINGCYNFIHDIHNVCKKLQIKACIKQKKKSDHLVPKKYTKLIKEISKYIDLIDPEFSPRELIENSDLVISFPYSTTNTLAEKLSKKNTFYYSGYLSNKWLFDDGKKVITNTKELEEWIISNLKKSQ